MSNEPEVNQIDPEDDFWSLPKEDAINQLMKEFDMSREEAEAVLQRDRTQVRRHVMERLTREEYNEFLEEMARSGEEVFTLGSPPKEDEPDDEE